MVKDIIVDEAAHAVIRADGGTVRNVHVSSGSLTISASGSSHVSNVTLGHSGHGGPGGSDVSRARGSATRSAVMASIVPLMITLIAALIRHCV